MRAIILTKSYKDNGFCVVGFDLDRGCPARFVSEVTGMALPKTCMNGIEVFDEVFADDIVACPTGPQSENVLIDPYSIRRIRRCTFGVETIYEYMNHYTADASCFAKNSNHRIPDVSVYNHSIEMLLVENLQSMPAENGKSKSKCQYIYQGTLYSFMSMTDPDYISKKYAFRKAYIILTIPASPYINQSGDNLGYYKFVSAIYPIQ